MPSLSCLPQSGGISLVSGAIYSGTDLPVGGIQLVRAGADGINPIYIWIPPAAALSGVVSGIAATQTSGGVWSSGGFSDGMELGAGGSYFIPKTRLVSGIESIRVVCPANASGARLFWEAM